MEVPSIREDEIGTAIRNHNGYIYMPDFKKKQEQAPNLGRSL
jgi:hypothetical protein